MCVCVSHSSLARIFACVNLFVFVCLIRNVRGTFLSSGPIIHTGTVARQPASTGTQCKLANNMGEENLCKDSVTIGNQVIMSGTSTFSSDVRCEQKKSPQQKHSM